MILCDTIIKGRHVQMAPPESTGTRHSLGRTHWIICVVVIVILSTRLHVCNKIKDDIIITDIITIIDHFLKPWLCRSWDYDYLDHQHIFRLFGTWLMIFMSLWAPSLNVILTERRWRYEKRQFRMLRFPYHCNCIFNKMLDCDWNSVRLIIT